MLAAAAGAVPLPTAAEPVSQADLAAPPAADGGAAAGASGRDESIDLGETGKLLRLVDDAGRQRAPSSPPPMPRAAPRPNLEPARPAGEAAGIRFGAPSRDSAEPSLATAGRVDAPANSDPDGLRALVDRATPDQRNRVRETLVFVRSVLQHPASWIVLGLVGVLSLVLTASSRRGK